MLDWFNAVVTLFKEFLLLLFELPFYGSVSIGHILLAIAVFSIFLTVFLERIK